MAKIYVIRHAESIANREGIYQGQSYDTDLSSLGEDQAFALAERFSGLDISEVIASPLGRTMQTAEAIAMETGSDVIPDDRIIETNHGEWEGKNKKWIEENYPDVYKTWQTLPSKAVFPGGEVFDETVARVKQFMDEYMWSGNSVVVTHDNIIRIMVSLAKGSPVDDMWKVTIEPAAINTFEVKEGFYGVFYRVVKLNDTTHLKELKADLALHAL